MTPPLPIAADLPLRARQVVRACAGFDLLVTGCLAAPPAARALFAALDPFDRALGGSGLPVELPALGWLFVHLTGALGVLWALVRLRRPTRFLGWADALGRAWVGLLILRFALAGGAPRVFLLFVATEWAGALAQLACLRRR